MHDTASFAGSPESPTIALQRVLEAANGRPMAIREVVEIMQGRGLQMMVVFLCLPFLMPVTIPGISIPFGVAIIICGFRIALGHQPWLPGFILDRSLSFSALDRMVRFGCGFYRRVERLTKPRLSYLFEGPMLTLVGLTIALAGFLLSLPIPPPFPFTNTIPGFAIIFLSLGLMERDGGFVIAGYLLTALGTAYIILIALLGKAGVMHLWEMFFGS